MDKIDSFLKLRRFFDECYKQGVVPKVLILDKVSYRKLFQEYLDKKMSGSNVFSCSVDKYYMEKGYANFVVDGTIIMDEVPPYGEE